MSDRRWLKRGVLAVAVAVAAAGGLAGVLVASGSASTASAPVADIVPIPSVHATTATALIHHHTRVLVKSLRVSGLTAPRPIITCGGCLRYTGTVKRLTPASGTVLYENVNWLLVPGHDIKVATYRAGAVGRFELLTASARPGNGLIFKASGCLRSLTRSIRCPQGVGTPITGAPIQQNTTPAPTTTTPTSQPPTTTIGSGPTGASATLPVNFTYSSSTPSATFECSLDGGGWASCPGTGISYSTMTPGSHTFSVRAIAGALLDPSPPVRMWTQTAPGVTPTVTSPPPPPPPPPPSSYTETTGPVTNKTFTNYTNAGGNLGPTIAANTTLQVACRVTGFQVADGDTWWYRIASSPWNGTYYATADAFYNNGQTSGSLHGTPFVDPNVPGC